MNTLVASISLAFCSWLKSNFGFFEKTKIVSSPVGNVRADDLVSFLVYDNLAFNGVAFLFAGVVTFLSFFGRSIGVSVASTNTTS